jgi:putative FmdB family regulatory protein
MPIYEYRCRACGFEKEYLQKLADAPIELCEGCGQATMSKLMSAAGFQLKGSGWYATDFKNQGAKPKAEDKEADKKDTDKKDTDKKDADKKDTDKKGVEKKDGDKKEPASKDKGSESSGTGDSAAPQSGAGTSSGVSVN